MSSDNGFIYMISGAPGIYVGQTYRSTVREREHRHELENGNHWNHLLQRAVFEHGMSAFEFRVIQEDVPAEQMDIVEQQWIDAVGTFNLAPAGQLPNNKGRKHSKEHRRKNSEAKIGKTPWKGRTLSPEHRAKLAASRTGLTRNAETRAKMSTSAKLAWTKRKRTMNETI